MSLIVIDNYDSFTYNLVHYLGELGAQPVVLRNDQVSVAEIEAQKPAAIVLSPGPCTPNEAGICLDLVKKMGETTPILGVCLGHQSIGQAYGGDIIRAKTLMHGKTSAIKHTSKSVFAGLNGPVKVTRYHSLTIDETNFPDVLEVTATADDGTIMGVMHKEHPVHGVQFHPESIASEHGHHMLRNFLDLANRRADAAKGKTDHG